MFPVKCIATYEWKSSTILKSSAFPFKGKYSGKIVVPYTCVGWSGNMCQICIFGGVMGTPRAGAVSDSGVTSHRPMLPPSGGGSQTSRPPGVNHSAPRISKGRIWTIANCSYHQSKGWAKLGILYTLHISWGVRLSPPSNSNLAAKTYHFLVCFPGILDRLQAFRNVFLLKWWANIVKLRFLIEYMFLMCNKRKLHPSLISAS